MSRFAEFGARRSAAAAAALEEVATIADHSPRFRLRSIGDDWSRGAFDGPFFQTPAHPDRPSCGVVFVASASGDTMTDDPAALGGGNADAHLIYEGLTRVGADAIVAGAATLHGDSFFSVWRPELIALRSRLRLPRHPVQVVLSASGSIDLDAVLLFNVPDVRVIVLASPDGTERLSRGVRHRPWIRILTGTSVREQFAELKRLGIDRACCVGGRTSATALVDAGLVDDVYLTRAPGDGAAAGTPWYAGQRPPALDSVLLKQWTSDQGRVRFAHWIIRQSAVIDLQSHRRS